MPLINKKMALKFHYDEQDDVFTTYDSENAPLETIEFSEFLNIDINKYKQVVGLEIFYASEFFKATNTIVTKSFLKSLESISIECKNHRNNWFIVLVFKSNGAIIKVQMPPLRKPDYESPLIASC